MPCKNAMITKVISIRPDQTVGDALELFEKHQIRSVVVVNEEYSMLGLYNFHQLLEDLLPISFDEGDDSIRHFKHTDVSLDYLGETAPWVAHRLNMIIGRPVKDFMKKDIKTVAPDTPLREAMRLIVLHDSPLPVIEDKRLLGIVTSQTIAKAIMDIAGEMKKKNTKP